MHTRLFRLALTGLLFVSLGACDDDGGNEPTGRVPQSTVCVAPFTALNRGDLEDMSTSGACANTDSWDTVCTTTLSVTAGECGTQCLADVDPRNCIIGCMQGMVEYDATPDCYGCYADSVVCVVANCLLQCISNPQGYDCAVCREMKGCNATFYACAGLPAQPLPSSDAGL